MFLVALAFLFGQDMNLPDSCDALQSDAVSQEARRDLSSRAFEKAAGEFQRAFTACPQNLGLLIEKGNALLRAGKFGDARTTAITVLHVDPRNAAALKIKGNAEYFLGEFDQSMGTFITLLDRHPSDEDGAYMLGRIYYQEGRTDQA